jgi:CBS domain containing-hemolysin-like protein
MKTGNVILAIFIWLMIPVLGGISFLFGAFYSATSGDSSGGMLCCLIVPCILFIVGLLVLLHGRDTPKNIPIQKPREVDRYCPNCGRNIPFDVQICPYCRKDFSNK